MGTFPQLQHFSSIFGKFSYSVFLGYSVATVRQRRKSCKHKRVRVNGIRDQLWPGARLIDTNNNNNNNNNKNNNNNIKHRTKTAILPTTNRYHRITATTYSTLHTKRTTYTHTHRYLPYTCTNTAARAHSHTPCFIYRKFTHSWKISFLVKRWISVRFFICSRIQAKFSLWISLLENL